MLLYYEHFLNRTIKVNCHSIGPFQISVSNGCSASSIVISLFYLWCWSPIWPKHLPERNAQVKEYNHNLFETLYELTANVIQSYNNNATNNHGYGPVVVTAILSSWLKTSYVLPFKSRHALAWAKLQVQLKIVLKMNWPQSNQIEE